jgi:quercetin dioxygenase-like cupin family protein
MSFRALTPDQLGWDTRPHADGEPARHVAELSEALGAEQVRANIWRYESGARGRRHRHAEQEETFIVLQGTLTMYVGEPPQRTEVPKGGVVKVAGMTPLQVLNEGDEDLLLYVYGFPPDEGAEVLESAL